MRYLLDAAYLLALVVFSPWLVYRVLTTGKYRRGLGYKFLGQTPRRESPTPCAWFHGVSVGEVHLLGQVVACFRRRHPDWDCVVSTTTDTGYDEACKRFPDLRVFFWPLDFSWAVRRALRRVNPRLVVLAEGDLWPNFLAAAKEMEISVAIVNGRMSPRSFWRYRRFGRWARGLLEPVDLFAVPTEEYAAHLRALGAAAERVYVTGSVEYDGVSMDRHNPRTEALRRLLRVESGDLVWIAGSTQAPEEEICLTIFQRLQLVHPNLRLFLVPRQKERFDEVANLLSRADQPFARRSALREETGPSVLPSSCPPVILVDTIGELGALWGLADVTYVGGSLDGQRGGQNMIEPAAYGAAVLFGPYVWNFSDKAARLTAGVDAVEVTDDAGRE